ncbi:MAG: GTP-binding protein EngB [Parcubacteria group bacterium Gr01-1014_18]|nr:MAG: GTP-binding protein EngB [Parcubacteria group bacterium Greene0416_36]TSC80835.1 MAG: GTP-binding protein EngB [Parcubacteria group bacterium Gr01-1014_18]TSC99496.1 MAG: GTP-binding protein EngB [Parcubacteria group bacterium Greene1014_20]TSD07585.1 MAG: GTP-binding protein EngB [Parcubacteria group bacterium Greene0714_2]
MVGPDPLMKDGKPQVAIIGRSNSGKSSLINSLVGVEGLARTSAYPGLTRELNLFLINKSFYLVDLPGYGFAKGSMEDKEKIHSLIGGYLFESGYVQKRVVLVIDSAIGMTESDLEMLGELTREKKHVVIVANKIDKIKKSDYARQMRLIQDQAQGNKVIPYSSFTRIGQPQLSDELFSQD